MIWLGLIFCLLGGASCSSKVSKGRAQRLVKEVKKKPKKLASLERKIERVTNRAKVQENISSQLAKIVLERFLDNLLARRFEDSKKDVTNNATLAFNELQQVLAIIPKEQLDELFLVYTKSMYQTITCLGTNKVQTCSCCCSYDGGNSFEPFSLINEKGTWKVDLSTSIFLVKLKK